MMKKLSDRELLSILLGEEGESYSMRSLAELFGLRVMRHEKPIGVAEEVLVHRHIHCDFYQPKLISNLPQ